MMNIKCACAAGALILTGPAFGATVNMTDFTFPPAISVNTSGAQTYSGVAGQYTGTLDGTSFTAYCAELTQSFVFNVPQPYTQMTGTSYFGAQKSMDISRLFTATAGQVTDASTAGAMQSAIWEIVYESGTTYDMNSGIFSVAPASGADAMNFMQFNSVLANLGSYGVGMPIDVLHSPDYQDFIPVPSIPEPGTWALLVAGMGVIGFLKRRRQS